MQTLYYNTDHYMTRNGNLVDLEVYRCKMEQLDQSKSGGLPPLPRREHRCPLGLRFCDLVSMSMVALTLCTTGVILAGL